MFFKKNTLHDEEENEELNNKLSSLEDLQENEFEEELDEYGDGDDYLVLPGEDEAENDTGAEEETEE